MCQSCDNQNRQSGIIPDWRDQNLTVIKKKKKNPNSEIFAKMTL